MRYGIGIDTGGTYTDAVVYDFAGKKVLAAAKALTTRRDLCVGIMAAMDQLPPELLAGAGIVAISTTLATNACVENKLGRARLVFFGDRRVIERHGGEFGLPPGAEIYIQDNNTTYTGAGDAGPDWELFEKNVDDALAGMHGAGVVEIYSMRNAAVAEKRARDIIRARTGVPVVCGHELSSGLNCLQRGAGTLLNASLFPLIDHFIAAIKRAMAQRELAVPFVIVRSDGSMMSEEFSAMRPVETLLCGPAASVIGCAELVGEPNAVVVDMGGTTTDIALIRDGVPVKAENGIGIGKWKTFINGLSIHTFGLGGDSEVRVREGAVALDNRRVVPLCMAAAEHPSVFEQLRAELEALGPSQGHSRPLHRFFALARDIAEDRRYSDDDRRFCEALRGGPVILRRAAAAVGRDEYTLDVSRLVGEGVVQVCGFTPTDVMHLKGDFRRFPAEASRLGAVFVAACLRVSVDELCDLVYEEVKRKLHLGVVQALLGSENEEWRRDGLPPDAEALVDAGFRASRRGGRPLTAGLRTDYVLVGIGAPIHVFLPDVAAALGTKAIIPPHAEVANAIGAVAGKVRTTREVGVNADYDVAGITGYTVFAAEGPRTFTDQEAAMAFAMDEARNGAREEAARRGALGEITVTCEVGHRNGTTNTGAIYLGATVVAHAVGGMGF